MANLPKFSRPTFDDAMAAWKAVLAERGLSTNLVWLFDENLCFEKIEGGKENFTPAYQTRFTPPPADAEQIAFDCFCETEVRLVFYRLGSSRGKSLCLILCDDWFETKGSSECFIRRDEWLISFRPGNEEEIAEITSGERWKNRIIRGRPLHDLDFCMTLRGVHEIMAHGHALSPYERYAMKFLHAWKRVLGQTE